MPACLRRFVACLLIVSTTMVSFFSVSAHAGLIGTDAAVAAKQRAEIGSLLQRSDVQSALAGYGVAADQVSARVAAMSDEEVATLAREIEALPAGGDALIGAIVFVFVLLLVTDILGLTKIFPFTRPVR